MADPGFVYTPDTTEKDVVANTNSSKELSANPDNNQSNQPTSETVSWQASEFIEHSKNISWFLALAGGTIVLGIIMYLLTKNYLVIGVILLSALAVGQMAKLKPRINDYSLSIHGLTINGNFQPISNFRSYSIFLDGTIPALHFEPAKNFANPVTIYFSPEEEKLITNILGQTIPQDTQKYSTIDKMMKKIRF